MGDSEKRRAWSGPALLAHGFRPFFLLGAIYAALAIPLWLAAFTHGYSLGVADPLRWHVHEMLFGFLAAIVAGFLLTAIPNWTGRLPVMGWPLAGFVLLWLAGRVAMALGSGPVASAVDAAFLVALAGFAWREVLVGSNWRNVPVCLAVSTLALANILFHAEAPLGLPVGLGWRLALAAALLLISLIGGRVIPSFTTNWMKRQGITKLPTPFGRFDALAVIWTGALLLAWAALPDARLVGYGLIAAGTLQLVRLLRWRGWATLPDPLVTVLHLGFLWLVLALLAMGLAILRPDLVSASQALHAATTGAIGQMTLAMMTRASLGHGGRELKAGPATLAAYALVLVGAALRVVLPSTGVTYSLAMSLAGAAWSGGFALFAIAYGPLLVRRRV